MSSAERPSGRRVKQHRPSLLEELTDDVEPDESPRLHRRLTALLLLAMTVGGLAAGVAYVIVNMIIRTR